MGQSVNFVPVPAGLCCKSIDYGAIHRPSFMSGAVSVTSPHRDSGESCINSLISSVSGQSYAACAVIDGGVRHV